MNRVHIHRIPRAIGRCRNRGNTRNMSNFQHKIYVVADAAGACKIGVSRDPATRLQSLSAGQRKRGKSGVLRLVYLQEIERDAFAVERAAQVALSAFYIEGEWFSVSVEDAIRAVQAAAVLVGVFKAKPTGRRRKGRS